MNDQSDFRRVLRIARRRWAWLLFVPLVCSAVAFTVARSESKVYQAAADIRINGNDIATDVALITSQQVNAAARDRIGDESVNVLSVSASPIGDTQLARITSRATTPELAALAANEWAGAFADLRNEGQTADLVSELDGLLEASELLLPDLLDIEDRIAELEAIEAPSPSERSQLADLRSRESLLQSQQRNLVDRATAIQTQLITTPVIVTTTNQASEPRQPAEPKPMRQAVFGLLGGLFLGILAAGLAELLDDRIWEPSDLASASGWLPVLASIPSLNRAARTNPMTVTLARPQHPASEAFSMLGRTLRHGESRGAFPMILTTSAQPNEGTSLIASNIAAAFAQLGERVVLVDFNFREQGSVRPFGVDGSAGVRDAIESGRPFLDFVQPVAAPGREGLFVLSAGTTSLEPGNLTTWPRMGESLERLRGEFDRIIIDGGALLVGTEAVSLAENADGVCLVARYRATRGRDIERALGRLDQIGVAELGVVIWDAPDDLFAVGPQHRATLVERASPDGLNEQRASNSSMTSGLN